MKKRIIGLLTVAIAVFGCFTLHSAFAAEAATVNASKAAVNKGDEVTISVTMPDDLQRMLTFVIEIEYDSEAFEILKTDSAGWMLLNSDKENKAMASWVAEDVFGGDDYAGKTAEFVFKCKSDTAGDYAFTAAFDSGNCFDYQEKNVTIKGGTASVSVTGGETQGTAEPAPKEKGCGAVASSVAAVIMLATASVILTKKKERK